MRRINSAKRRPTSRPSPIPEDQADHPCSSSSKSGQQLITQISNHPLIEPSLRLTDKGINWLPKQLFQLSYIENLYLNDNLIEVLPERFFEKLPMLKYLDLRNNLLTEVPNRGLDVHQNLEYLLVSRNKIRALPKELGCVKSLKGVSWHSNPLEYPEKRVLESDDFGKVKKFLRNDFRKNCA